MKAITLWQPWATAMAVGLKKIETRDWSTKYRGDLAICAAHRPPADGDLEAFLTIADAERVRVPLIPLPLGCVVCVVELYVCEPTAGPEGMDATEACLGNFGHGRFAWRTRNLRPLRDPLPIIGRQRLWQVSRQVEEIIAFEVLLERLKGAGV
jgi:H+/Cl- antiporter ClcA